MSKHLDKVQGLIEALMEIRDELDLIKGEEFIYELSVKKKPELRAEYQSARLNGSDLKAMIMKLFEVSQIAKDGYLYQDKTERELEITQMHKAVEIVMGIQGNDSYEFSSPSISTYFIDYFGAEANESAEILEGLTKIMGEDVIDGLIIIMGELEDDT